MHFTAINVSNMPDAVNWNELRPREGLVINMKHKTTKIAVMLAWLLAAGVIAGVTVPLRAETGPVAVLQQMTEYVTDVVRRDTGILNDTVRLRVLANEAVLPNVDFVTLSRWVLGKHWRKATPAQQDAFMTQFREMLLVTYLRRVNAYRETAVRFQPLRAAPQDDRVEVQAEVEPQGGPVVNILFRMHLVDGRWLIYDVAVEGISLVATHRSGFSQEISRNGLDSLIARLTEMNQAAVASGEKCVGC
jgi:phospholipid transport system substrate-binding protein